jgi:Tfp pilus assembly protein PilF
MIGLGQVQLKLGDFRSAQSNFEKVLEIYPDNCETMKVSEFNESVLAWLFHDL